MKQVVLISGKQGAGKTTLTNALWRRLLDKGAAAKEIRFAGTIYEIHDFARARLEALGIELPEPLKVKDGPMLQWLGTEWGRKTIADDIWVRCAQGAVAQFHEDYPGRAVALVSDCRFRNECDAFPQALRVRLECPKDTRKGRCEAWRENDVHPSEIDLDDYVHAGRFDMVFNTGTQPVDQIVALVVAQLDKNVWAEKRTA